MTEPDKKISFGFSKLKKPNSFIKPPIVEEKKVELIDCLEGQSIKIKDKVEQKKGPLIIPIPENSRSIVDRIKNECIKNELKKQQKANVTKKDQVDKILEKPESEMTLDELAVKRLLEDAQKRETKTYEPTVHSLPLVEDKLIIEGKAEPTMDDYDSVPISDYGMAMLRGMGWKEDIGIGKNPKSIAKVDAPELRPRGMGLGADKVVKKEPERQSVDKDGKELTLIKGAFVKISGGHQDGYYGQVQGLDDEAGRIIVKTAIGGTILTLNEFRITLVTKEDFDKNGKIINNAKYTEYKEKETTGSKNRSRSRSIEKIKVKREPTDRKDESPRRNDSKNDKNNKNKKSSSDSDERHQGRKSASDPIRSKHSSKSRSRYEQRSTPDDDYGSNKKNKYSDRKQQKSKKYSSDEESSSSEEETRHNRKRRSDSSDSRDSSYDRKKSSSKNKSRKCRNDSSDSEESTSDRHRQKSSSSHKSKHKERKHKKKHKKEKKKYKDSDGDDDRRSQSKSHKYDKYRR